METVKRLFISLIVLLGCTAGAWAIEQDSEGYYLIGSVQDWQDFAAIVETTNDANAKMIADVDLGDDQTHIGSMAQNGTTYKGTFDGQGYTLTVAYVGGSRQIVAPFTNVQGATIKNLHVDGSISSVFAFIGVVGYVRGSGSVTTVSNVWNSATMSIQTGEWAQSGAIVGGFNNGSVLITDCLFTGSFTTNQGGYCGCFTGYTYSAGSITQTNCLSTGTFSMSGTGFRGTHSNCYVSSFPASFPSGVAEATAEGISDGTITTALGDGWAQDPLTHRPVPKIFTTVQDEDGNYLIGSVTDWKRFAAIVETTPNANAKMVADVDLGDDQTELGSVNNPYKGTFDGQGHALTVAYSVTGSNSDHVAPFASIENATIENLHIKGTITTAGMRPAGITSYVSGTSFIRNCWSEVAITSSKASNIDAGGFVTRVNENQTLYIDDCIFTGSINYINANGYDIGGLVGHTQVSSKVYVSNCLFAPYNIIITRESDLNDMFVGHYGGGAIIENSYYNSIANSSILNKTQGSYATDEQIADGTTSNALQVNREEEIWVQDPVLGIPMLKLFANIQDEDGNYLIGSVTDWKRFADIVKTTPTANAKMVADVDLGDDQTRIGDVVGDGSGVKFGGIFDGQGHTLTVAYSITGHNMCAPFTKTNGATIKNLHVAGTMRTEFCHLAGIIADAYGTNTIENVWVSADLTSANNYNTGGILDLCGAIVGCKKNGNLTISDCLFTGTITTINNSIWNGSILGYIDGGDQASATITNCLSVGTFNYTEHETNIPNRGTISNSYVYQFPTTIPAEMQVTDGEISDGTTAATLQDGRVDEIWVQDPVLGIPMLKIFANEETEQPSEALNGVFTINASGEKVSFAKGNLQKIGSTYQFAEHQYDYFGKNQSDAHRDMFSFNNFSTPNSDDNWFNMTHDQWVYLLRDRSVTNTLSDGAHFTMATIGGTYKGVILFPDNYIHPEGTGFTPGVFDSYSNYTAQISLEGWALMEAAGCVFLPSCGWKSKGNEWKSVGETAVYSTTSVCSDDVTHFYTPCFYVDRINYDGWCHRDSWAPVRLVMRLQPLTYTVPASGVGTFSSEVNIHLPEGLNAHYCKTYYAERSAISVVNISSGVVPANTGVLLSGTPGETFNLYPTPETADELEGNALVAVTKPTHISATKGDYTNFMMKGGKFIRIEAASYTVKMPANRAYLPLLTSAISGSNAKEIMLYWDDEEAAGIERMRNVENEIMRIGNIYNLNGQKLSAPQKGINIINGRKVIVK